MYAYRAENRIESAWRIGGESKRGKHSEKVRGKCLDHHLVDFIRSVFLVALRAL